MKSKKWKYIVFIVLLVLPILFFYNALNGNPLSKQLSKSTIKSYMASTYPDHEFVLSKPAYNFKDAGYYYHVTQIGDPEQTNYQFIVTGFFGSSIYYDAIYYANQDTKLISKLQSQANNELTSLFKGSVPEILGVEVQLEILKEKHALDSTLWTKDFEPERPMNIHIKIDTRKLSTEDVLNAAKIIQKKLNDNDYTYRNITINANVLSEENEKEGIPYWHVKYVVSFDEETVLKLKQIIEYK